MSTIGWSHESPKWLCLTHPVLKYTQKLQLVTASMKGSDYPFCFFFLSKKRLWKKKRKKKKKSIFIQEDHVNKTEKKRRRRRIERIRLWMQKSIFGLKKNCYCCWIHNDWPHSLQEWKVLLTMLFFPKRKKKNNTNIYQTSKKGAIIGQFTRLLRSLELRAVSHCTVLLLWDQKLLLRMRDCFEGSKRHLPTLWLDAVDACMTCLQENCKSAQQQSQRDCLVRSYCQSWGFCMAWKTSTYTPIRANEKKKERREEEWKWNEISYVLAKLSLSYPVKINSARNTPRLFFFQWLLCRLRRRRSKKKKNEKKQHKEKNKSKQMPSQDKWDCIKQLSAVAQVNVKRMERKVKCNNNNQLNWEHLFKPSG